MFRSRPIVGLEDPDLPSKTFICGHCFDCKAMKDCATLGYHRRCDLHGPHFDTTGLPCMHSMTCDDEACTMAFSTLPGEEDSAFDLYPVLSLKKDLLHLASNGTICTQCCEAENEKDPGFKSCDDCEKKIKTYSQVGNAKVPGGEGEPDLYFGNPDGADGPDHFVYCRSCCGYEDTSDEDEDWKEEEGKDLTWHEEPWDAEL